MNHLLLLLLIRIASFANPSCVWRGSGASLGRASLATTSRGPQSRASASDAIGVVALTLTQSQCGARTMDLVVVAAGPGQWPLATGHGFAHFPLLQVN